MDQAGQVIDFADDNADEGKRSVDQPMWYLAEYQLGAKTPHASVCEESPSVGISPFWFRSYQEGPEIPARGMSDAIHRGICIWARLLIFGSWLVRLLIGRIKSDIETVFVHIWKIPGLEWHARAFIPTHSLSTRSPHVRHSSQAFLYVDSSVKFLLAGVDLVLIRLCVQAAIGFNFVRSLPETVSFRAAKNLLHPRKSELDS
jgi:hypothetical protein